MTKNVQITMTKNVQIALVENSSAGNPPKIFPAQTVEIVHETDTSRTGVDGFTYCRCLVASPTPLFQLRRKLQRTYLGDEN